jgi:glutamine---fructose-6-phosphate transaminase (isomerizing)
VPLIPRTESTSEFQPLEDKEVEYFFASDASAVIEHTNRVIYLEVSHRNIKNFIIIISNSC